MKHTLIVLAMTLFCNIGLAQQIAFPQAEYTAARQILMYTPGEELFDGVVHPDAALFDAYFDVDAAAREHKNYIKMLRDNGIEVFNVEEVLEGMPHAELQRLATPHLKYDISRIESADAAQVERYRLETLAKMSNRDLVRVILRHPTVVLEKTDINTGYSAIYQHEPLMNMYFLRDQSITTPVGQVMCRMNSAQRYPEVDIIESCYRQMGYTPVYRISGENSYLEGGDYIPFGSVALIGQGLRTTQGAIDELLANDVIGHDTLVVVRDHWNDQYQMHLDTYFNVIDKDLCTLCFNRYDAKDASDPNFLTIDMYARKPGEKTYRQVKEYAGYSFKRYLGDRGVDVIRISKEDADHYANNFLAIDGRHIMSVAHQSKALADEYARRGVKVEWVELENLIGGYGAAHCMTQVMKRETCKDYRVSQH